MGFVFFVFFLFFVFCVLVLPYPFPSLSYICVADTARGPSGQQLAIEQAGIELGCLWFCLLLIYGTDPRSSSPCLNFCVSQVMTFEVDLWPIAFIHTVKRPKLS